MRRRKPRPRQALLFGRGRGGPRPGAGRPKTSSRIPHVRRARVTRHDGVHVTLRLVPGAPDLRHPAITGIIERVFAAECDRKGFRLVHFAVQTNHLHLICEADDTLALSRGIQRVAAWIARAINKRTGRRGALFADRFHNRVVSNPPAARNLLRYVLLQENKDSAKRGDRVIGYDIHASGAYFDGWADVKPRPPPIERWVVTRPRSWLMSAGWRRAGGPLRTDEKAPITPGT